MAIEILNSIIHRIDKVQHTSGKGSVALKPRQIELPKDEILRNLCENLIDSYNKISTGNGTLGQDPNAHKFTFDLKDHITEKTSFISLTNLVLKRLQEKMEASPASSGGYVLFLKYKTDQHQLFLVAMLKIKSDAGIDSETLILKQNLNFDLNKLHEAARVNITRWNGNVQPYLTFIKGKAKSASEDVSQYFRDALSCTNYTDSKHHTKAIIEAAEKFIEDSSDIPPEKKPDERQAMRKRLYECFVDNHLEVPLTTVAATVFPKEPELFVDYVKAKAEADGYNLGDAFTPHKPTYNKLHRFRARMGTVHLAFDVEDIINGRVEYSEEFDAIIVKKPANILKEAIQNNGTLPAADQSE